MDLSTPETLWRAVAPLVIAFDGDECVIGRPELGLYVAVPIPGGVLLGALQDGASLDEATARASEAAGQEVDGTGFLEGLAEAGVLADVGAEPDGAPGRRIRWIEGVSPRVARPFFGKMAWLGYGLAAVTAVGLLLFRPDLRPAFEDAFFLEDPVLSVLAFLPIAVLLGAAHEAWHWLAGRAIDVPAVFRVSRRGIFLVFETDLSQLAAVPRRRRYGPFLAGMALDTVLLAVTLGARALYRAELLALPPVVDRLLAVVVLTQVMSVVWQWAAVFLRSDGYAVLANLLRCHNLYRATWLTVKDRLFRLGDDEAAEFAEISPHDRKVAAWFAVIYLAGITVTSWLTVTFGLPFLVSMLAWAVTNLRGLAITSLPFWESLALLGLVVVQYGVPLVLAVRERKLRKAGDLL
jgi:hypothetical protein